MTASVGAARHREECQPFSEKNNNPSILELNGTIRDIDYIRNIVHVTIAVGYK
jgi:hypothetical protein